MSNPKYRLKTDEILAEAIVKSTQEGLQMTDVQADAVGLSPFETPRKDLSVIVGLQGRINGNLSLNLTEHTAKFLASKLMGESFDSLNEEAADALCEIGNTVAGRLKDRLSDTKFAFNSISLPALIYGGSFNIFLTSNIQTISLYFDINDSAAYQTHNNCFTFSASVAIFSDSGA